MISLNTFLLQPKHNGAPLEMGILLSPRGVPVALVTAELQGAAVHKAHQEGFP